MNASYELVVYAKVVLAVFVILALWSWFALVRWLRRPLITTAGELAKVGKAVLLSSWVAVAGIAAAVNAIVKKEYYLLAASAILLSIFLPLLFQYLRMRSALK